MDKTEVRELLQSLKKDVEFIYRSRDFQQEQDDLDEIVRCQYHIQDTVADIIDYLIAVV